MVPYREFLEQYGGLSADEFVAEFPEPLLLLPDLSGRPRLASHIDTRRVSSSERVRALLDGVAVAPLRKRDPDSKARSISVGRQSSLDIVVPDEGVSKVQAYFQETRGEWYVLDASSSNGTWLDGKRLPAERATRLSTGAMIMLGGAIEAEFVTPRDLHARLAAEREALDSLPQDLSGAEGS